MEDTQNRLNNSLVDPLIFSRIFYFLYKHEELR